MSDNTIISESIVAYLDGELSPSESQKIEKRLAEDPTIRKDVDDLVRTWDMLDDLDEVRVSEQFTNKTLTSIQAAKSSETQVTKQSRIIREWLPTLATCLGIIVAITFGFASTRFDKTEGVKFRKLPFLEKLHVYEEVDVELARKLKESGLLDE